MKQKIQNQPNKNAPKNSKLIKTDVSTINNFCVGRNNHVQYLY